MHRLLVLSFLAGFAGAALAQDPPPPCSDPGHRQFDFWVGEWQVENAEGTVLGHNRIEKLLGDCALKENWRGAKGTIGYSFNIYDAAREQWHQTWVDGQGRLLLLDGGLKDGAMVLEGENPGPGGAMVKHRITWSPQEDGSVKQHWTISPDGKEWKDAFIGFYRRSGD